jgi:hypothetical protein
MFINRFRSKKKPVARRASVKCEVCRSANGTPRGAGDGGSGHGPYSAADNRAGRSCNSTNACADGRAANTLFSRGASRGREAKKGDESELLHEKPPETADGITGHARGVRISAGLHVTLVSRHGSGK